MVEEIIVVVFLSCAFTNKNLEILGEMVLSWLVWYHCTFLFSIRVLE